jgi:uracil-DNA glycosylase family 4
VPPCAQPVAAAGAAAAPAATERVSAPDLAAEWAGCTICALAASRSQVVAGEGPMPAELMLVADAPGFHDDRIGTPLAGPTGALLDDLLGAIGLARAEVYVTTLVKCRPPGTQSPAADEVAACRDKLERQIALVRPRVVAALGDLATRALAGGPHGVTQLHGQSRRAEIGGHAIELLPLYHPAAALYNARLLPALEADVRRLAELLGREVAAPVTPAAAPPSAPSTATPAGGASPDPVDEQQLGLF